MRFKSLFSLPYKLQTLAYFTFENSSNLIVGGFQEAAGIVGKYADNTWMAGFAGMIDQVRLYGTALSAAEIAALYAGKQ